MVGRRFEVPPTKTLITYTVHTNSFVLSPPGSPRLHHHHIAEYLEILLLLILDWVTYQHLLLELGSILLVVIANGEAQPAYRCSFRDSFSLVSTGYQSHLDTLSPRAETMKHWQSLKLYMPAQAARLITLLKWSTIRFKIKSNSTTIIRCRISKYLDIRQCENVR